MSIPVEEKNSINIHSNKKEPFNEQTRKDFEGLKTNFDVPCINNENELKLHINKNKHSIDDDVNKNKNSDKKTKENITLNYIEGKNLKERTDNINKISSMTPKNISKFPRLSKNMEKLDTTLSKNKKANVNSERSKKQTDKSPVTAKNNKKDIIKQDTSVSNLNKTREEKKIDNVNENKNIFDVIQFFKSIM